MENAWQTQTQIGEIMKIKACCIGTPPEMTDALSARPFTTEVLQKVVGDNLGVKDVLDRPAEYYVQTADVGPAPQDGMMGVEVRLTGVSRRGRTPKQFHQAKQTLEAVVAGTVLPFVPAGKRCQVFCSIMADGEVENPPGSGEYSSVIETKAIWVNGSGTDAETTRLFDTRPVRS